jgi:lipopolysaccharide transport system permease protein
VLEGLFWINPFSHMVWCFQDIVYFGRIAHPYAWIVFPLLSLVVFYVGFRVFRKLRPMFGNVL